MRPPEYPMKGKPVEQTIVEIIDYLKAITIKDVQGGALKESRNGTTISIPTVIRPKILQPEINPFYPTLTGNETSGLLLYMASGYVEIRHKETSDSIENIVPTSIPPESSPLSVSVGNKITCKITEDGSGRVTAAVIEKAASTWPTSTATTLKGGDNASGTGGVKHIRLCEIVKVTDTPQVVIWHTGHIDHFCPELVENTGSSNAILKEFDATTGAWLLRTLTAGAGITLTQNANDVEIEAAAFSDGQDLNLITHEIGYYIDAGSLTFTSDVITYVDCWRLGIYVGSFDYGDTLPSATGGGVVLTERNTTYLYPTT